MKTKSLSAGVMVVRFIDHVPHYLLLRVYGYWDFPKGLVEADEEPLAAAIREVEEETGLTGLDFRWGRSFRQTPPYRKGAKMARYYLAESTQGEVFLPVSEELGHPEHDDFQWFPYAEARKRLADRVKPALDWGHSLASGKLCPTT